MKLTTKFDHNDVVYSIYHNRPQHFVLCSFCGGEGRIVGADGSETNCPMCYGHKGEQVYDEHPKWMVRPEGLTVGHVRVEITFKHKASSMFSNYGSQKYEYEERYMMYETGIGSGTLHNADNLFASVEEAQAECDRRNDEAL